jgi:phage shock protein PspC (stress-responsive transcriptional regulator)
MIGGVAAGLGSYFRIDPTLIRLAFLLLMFVSGGAFLLIYMLMWVLLPTAGSTAIDSNQVVQENLEEIKGRVRGFTGGNSGAGKSGSATAQGNGGGNGSAETPTANAQGQAQLAQVNSASSAQARQGANPMILIGIGLFFLLANLGLFRAIHWGMWWPLLLIGLGALLLSRRS